MAELRVLDAEPRGQSVIKVLQDALSSARRGELSSVAIAFVGRDGNTDWDWSEVPNISALAGTIYRMNAALVRSVDSDGDS